MITLLILAVFLGVVCWMAIPPLARVYLWVLERYYDGVEYHAADMIRRADRMEEDDDDDNDSVTDELVSLEDVWADAREVHGEADGPRSWKVRAGHATRFQRKMSYWLKAEFPGGVRARTVADDEVMRLALAKRLRAIGVRHKDIIVHTPRIMTLAYLPTRAEIIEAELRASHAMADRLAAADVGKAPRTWIEWLAGRERRPGLTLRSK